MHIILLIIWYGFLIWLGFKLLGATFHVIANWERSERQQKQLIEHVMNNSFPWKYIGRRGSKTHLPK